MTSALRSVVALWVVMVAGLGVVQARQAVAPEGGTEQRRAITVRGQLGPELSVDLGVVQLDSKDQAASVVLKGSSVGEHGGRAGINLAVSSAYLTEMMNAWHIHEVDDRWVARFGETATIIVASVNADANGGTMVFESRATKRTVTVTGLAELENLLGILQPDVKPTRLAVALGLALMGSFDVPVDAVEAGTGDGSTVTLEEAYGVASTACQGARCVRSFSWSGGSVSFECKPASECGIEAKH